VGEAMRVTATEQHCVHGHEFTPENTRIYGNGYRQCVVCMRAANQRRYWRSKEAKKERKRVMLERLAAVRAAKVASQ
jgi:hypothetical protein